jgi:hypothetical protein
LQPLIHNAHNHVRYIEGSKIAAIFDHSPAAREVSSRRSARRLCRARDNGRDRYGEG